MINHETGERFWKLYKKLPHDVQKQAKKQRKLLQANPRHPSLQFKKVGQRWSVRVNDDYRALADPVKNGYSWFWIGSHADYDRLIKGN